ncbi:hypothetical protein CAEBREN_20529 [Caenorhabditis brenneri]|uniref:Uncharacterized protein n=1 Tax=Caenorhabditis brenneri TaxID=135651 RepID=G0MWW7_CAEBE|nr:hypothetical protein CAEBREN_20529 [Caenorhabditis brenneri]
MDKQFAYHNVSSPQHNLHKYCVHRLSKLEESYSHCTYSYRFCI